MWHILKPHWRYELKPDKKLTTVCDEWGTKEVPYEIEICDEEITVLPEGCADSGKNSP